MNDILTRIAHKTMLRVQAAKVLVSLEEMKKAAFCKQADKPKEFLFEKALACEGLRMIAECKKASPSKGIIDPVYDHLKIALGYEKAGADCISVLTEPEWFMGSNEHLREIAGAVSVPCLRKDFTVDEYMIYEAAVLGASAVLLICSLLDKKTLKHFIAVAHSLGLSALVEAHDRDEIVMALGAGARMIGVNNRNLRDFSVDLSNSIRLRRFVPEGVIFVAESGIKSLEDVAVLRNAGVDAVLVGEALLGDGGCGLIKAVTQPPSPRVKFCGMTRPEDIEAVNRLRPDYVGFVFAAGSRRRVTAEKAKALREMLDDGITVVGVFADDDAALVVKLLNDGVIDMAQLHGDEDDDYISFLKARTGGKPVIKAFKVRGPDTARRDIAAAAVSAADHILLDGSEGGSGIAFD